jgi:hypothetical protein
MSALARRLLKCSENTSVAGPGSLSHPQFCIVRCPGFDPIFFLSRELNVDQPQLPARGRFATDRAQWKLLLEFWPHGLKQTGANGRDLIATLTSRNMVLRRITKRGLAPFRSESVSEGQDCLCRRSDKIRPTTSVEPPNSIFIWQHQDQSTGFQNAMPTGVNRFECR